MTRQTLTQLRLEHAKAATDAVVRGTRKADHAKYATAAEETPVMIRTLGLGQTVATLAAKKDGGADVLAATLATWLLQDCPYSPWRTKNPADRVQLPQDDAARTARLLDNIAVAEHGSYRIAQLEAVEYAGWLKRLAQAFVPTRVAAKTAEPTTAGGD